MIIMKKKKSGECMADVLDRSVNLYSVTVVVYDFKNYCHAVLHKRNHHWYFRIKRI